MSQGASEVRELWPLLSVDSMERSLVYYRDRLAFELVGSASRDGVVYWCRLRRGGACLMLQQSEGVDAPSQRRREDELYLICDDADEIFAELRDRGLDVASPVVAEYGMKQLFVPEPDGRTLVFESPTADWAG